MEPSGRVPACKPATFLIADSIRPVQVSHPLTKSCTDMISKSCCSRADVAQYLTSRGAGKPVIRVPPRTQTERVAHRDRVIVGVGVDVDAASHADGVFADEALQGRGVIASAVVKQAGGVVFAARELLAVAAGRAGGAGLAEWLVTVAGLDRPAGIGQPDDAAQPIGDRRHGAACVRAAEELICAAGQQVGAGACSGLLLDDIRAVVEEAGGAAVDGLAGAAAQRVIGEGSGKARPADGGQLVASVPGVGVSAV